MSPRGERIVGFEEDVRAVVRGPQVERRAGAGAARHQRGGGAGAVVDVGRAVAVRADERLVGLEEHVQTVARDPVEGHVEGAVAAGRRDERGAAARALVDVDQAAVRVGGGQRLVRIEEHAQPSSETPSKKASFAPLPPVGPVDDEDGRVPDPLVDVEGPVRVTDHQRLARLEECAGSVQRGAVEEGIDVGVAAGRPNRDLLLERCGSRPRRPPRRAPRAWPRQSRLRDAVPSESTLPPQTVPFRRLPATGDCATKHKRAPYVKPIPNHLPRAAWR